MRRNKTYDLLYSLAYVLFCYGALVLTLYVRDGYFDMMEAKASCFRSLVYVLLPFLVITGIFKIKEKRLSFKDHLTLGVCAFALMAAVSTLLSSDRKAAWSGDQGWFVGLFVILTLTLVFLVLKDETFNERHVRYVLLAVLLFIYVFTIIQGTRADLFGLRRQMIGKDIYNYYATIGNSNWCVGYFALTVPALIGLYLNAEDKRQMAFFLVMSLLGLSASLIIGADAIYPAYGMMVLIMCPFLFRDKKNIQLLGILLAGLGMVLALIRISGLFKERLTVMSGISRLVFGWPLIAVIIAIGAIMYLLGQKLNEEKFDSIRKKLVTGVTVLLVIGGVAAAVSLFGSNANFSNGRLDLWKLSLQVYSEDFNILEKLFGVGPECLRGIYSILPAVDERIYVCSHSEFIQILLSIGLFGLLTWIFCWYGIFRIFLDALKQDRKEALPFLAGIFAYLGQSFFNSATIPNLCVLCFFAVMATGPLDDKAKRPETSLKQKRKRKA